MIRATDRVADVLKADPSLIDVFVSMSPAFVRLRNPAMRRVMGRLVTMQQAANMGGVEIEALLDRVNHSARGDNAQESDAATADPVSAATTAHTVWPDALTRVAQEDVVLIDVREELRAGREPFSLIMAARAQMRAAGALCVRATFEPVPLYAVMQKQHLAHWTEQHADDDWLVWFYPEVSDTVTLRTDVCTAHPGSTSNDDDVVILDVRNLEPPEPMVRTLAALEQLSDSATLVQINDRVPKFLLPLLDERGFMHEIKEQPDQPVRLFIRRRERGFHVKGH